MKKLLYVLITACFTIFGLAPGSATAQTSPIVTINQPNGGEQWVIGTAQLISWTSDQQLTKPVAIQLSIDGGSTYQTISDAGSVTGSTWTWNITTPTTGTPPYNDCKIRIISTTDQTVLGTSAAPFALVSASANAYIKVEQPNGVESWVQGTTHLISWVGNLDGGYDIYLNHYNSSNVLDKTYTLATDVSGSSYSWAIDNTLPLGAHYKILITGHTNTAVQDSSDNYFSITNTSSDQSIDVIQPYGGENWLRGTSHLISWTGNLQDKYDIYLVHYDASDVQDNIYTIATDVPASTYKWTIDANRTLGTHYKIKVTPHGNTSVSGVSHSYFSITDTPTDASILVIQPNIAGISWIRGTKHLISWTGNLNENYDILLRHYNSSNVLDTTYTIATNVPPSTHAWTIDSNRVLGSHYRILIRGHIHNSIADSSDNYFSIVDLYAGASIKVIQPNVSGISWLRGSTHLISWVGQLHENYNIYLVHYNSSNVQDKIYTIATNVPPSTHGWDIPSNIPLGTHYKVKINGYIHTNINALSENYFSITDVSPDATIRIIQPNGGESWAPGTAHLISWTGNLNENYDIYLYHYNTSNVEDNIYTIATNVPPSTTAWTIPSDMTLGTHYKVVITGHTHTDIADTSDNYFSITNASPGDYITIYQPDGGESWAAGTAHLISWTGNLSDDYNIYLRHYDAGNNLDTTYTIATNVPPSTYAWSIASNRAAGAHYRILITGYTHSSVADSSASYFSITDTPKVITYPNPSTNYVTVQVNRPQSDVNYLVTVYNRYGIRIWNSFLNTATSTELRFSTYDLPDGIYFMILTGGPQAISKTFIVQH